MRTRRSKKLKKPCMLLRRNVQRYLVKLLKTASIQPKFSLVTLLKEPLVLVASRAAKFVPVLPQRLFHFVMKANAQRRRDHLGRGMRFVQFFAARRVHGRYVLCVCTTSLFFLSLSLSILLRSLPYSYAVALLCCVRTFAFSRAW